MAIGDWTLTTFVQNSTQEMVAQEGVKAGCTSRIEAITKHPFKQRLDIIAYFV